MNRVYVYRMIVLSFILFSSCKDIIEKDLSKAQVVLLAPGNNTTSSNLSVNFWWEEVDGALAYRLQVVSPNFNQVNSLLLDTLVNDNKFNFLMFPGQYEWRVRAENGSSYSNYTIHGFSVDSNIDLTKRVVVLKTPINESHSNKFTQFFSWTKVDLADDYRFEVLDSLGNIIYTNPSLLTDTISFQFSGDGKYFWRVQGRNNLGQTTLYTTRTLFIDTNPPAAPLIIGPPNDSLVSNPFVLQWQRAPQTGVVKSDLKDSLYIYSDNVSFAIVRAILTSNLSYTDTLSSGDYYWRVKSTDLAGNRSPFSILNRFIIP